jgi:hypothetical protein
VATIVSRHDFPAGGAAAEANAARAESLGRMLDRLETSEMSRGRALNSALTVAKSYCADDSDASKFQTWESWVIAMQIGCALFDSATASEGPVACRIGVAGEVRNLPATGPTSYTHAGAWVTSVYLATICRENDRLDRLMRVPVSFLRESSLRTSGTELDEYIYAWVEALQKYWFRQADGMWSALVSAIDGTNPETTRAVDREMMLSLLYPPLELFQLYNRGDTERFNTSLAQALTWHKQYWTRDEARLLSSDGLVALGPLAIACMAYDNDFPIEVESPYLPKELLQFGWAGEADT